MRPFCSPLPRNKSLCRNIHTNYFVISPLPSKYRRFAELVIFVGHVPPELVWSATIMTIVVSLITRLNRGHFSQNTCRLVALHFVNCYCKRNIITIIEIHSSSHCTLLYFRIKLSEKWESWDKISRVHKIAYGFEVDRFFFLTQDLLCMLQIFTRFGKVLKIVTFTKNSKYRF